MNRSLIILAAGAAGVILGTAGLISYVRSHPEYSEIILRDDSDKRNFLQNCGILLKREPPEKLEITLPAGGDSVIFGKYCILQSKQQLPISEHFGESAEVWTYAAESSPSARVQLICTKDGLLIGAMHYECNSFDRMYSVISS